MASTVGVKNVASGWNWSAYIGCETRDGRAIEATAETIRGGWAPTRRKAEERAHAAVGEYTD